MTGKAGWWELMVGPGKPVDTDRFFVICSNILGGCMGTTGPKEINPETGKPWGLGFPVITIGDMVRAQAMLVDHLGIKKLFAVIGGSIGGMQVLEWAAAYPDRIFAAAPIATADHHSAQNIAFHEVGRQSIMADPDWCGGDYMNQGRWPTRGLAVARMTAHITYMSEIALQAKFGRRLQDRETVTYGFDADFQVESYLRHQGSTFVERFDANSYLYITRATDYFDLAESHGGSEIALFPGYADPLLRDFVHQRLAVPNVREPQDRACAQRRRGKRQLRRDRNQFRPRLLPAERPRVPPRVPRIPGRRRRTSRAAARIRGVGSR